MYVGMTNVVSEVFMMQVAVHSEGMIGAHLHKESIPSSLLLPLLLVTCREEGVDIVLLVVVTC